MKSEKELKQIARDIYSGSIFTDRHVKNSIDIPRVFMLLSLLEKKQIKELKNSDPGLIYEYIEKATPLAVNGYPSFLSFKTLSKKEYIKVKFYYEKIKKAIETI